MGKKKESSFLMQGTILAVAAIVSKLIGLVYRIPLTNILGAEGNGYYGIVFQVYNLALMLTSYSLPMAVSKLVSARLANGQYRNVQKVLKNAMTFGLIAGGVVAIIVFAGAGIICSQILKMELSVYALRCLAPCILIVAVLGVLRGYFQGHSTMIPTAISQVLEQIVHVIVSLVCAYSMLQMGKAMATGDMSASYGAAYGAAGATIGTVIGALFAMIFLIVLYFGHKKTVNKKIAAENNGTEESSKYIFKVLLLTIAPIILSATLYNITNILDQGIFTNIMSMQGYAQTEYSKMLGVYNGQYDTLMGIPASIASALAASFMPSLVAALQTGSKQLIHNKINLVSRFNMIIAIPCAVAFIVISKPLLDLLFYTQDNTMPATFLKLGGISVVFLCLSTVTNAALQGLDRMSKPVKNAAIALVIHVIALLVMMLCFDLTIYAVVISKVIFAAIICVLNAVDLYKACEYKQEFKYCFILPGIASIIMGAAAYLVQHFTVSIFGNAIATILAMIIAVIVYGVALVCVGGVSETDLLSFPKGTLLVRVLKKIHLLR